MDPRVKKNKVLAKKRVYRTKTDSQLPPTCDERYSKAGAHESDEPDAECCLVLEIERHILSSTDEEISISHSYYMSHLWKVWLRR
jgi:hypothetical protein